MNLIVANTGIFEEGIRREALMALEACDYGEILPLLKATKNWRKVNWTILQLQWKAIECVHYRVAGVAGVAEPMKKNAAEAEVAKAFGRGINTIRTWERRLRKEFGEIEFAQRLESAQSWAAMLDQDFLEFFAEQYKTEVRKRAGRPSAA